MGGFFPTRGADRRSDQSLALLDAEGIGTQQPLPAEQPLAQKLPQTPHVLCILPPYFHTIPPFPRLIPILTWQFQNKSRFLHYNYGKKEPV